MVSLFCQKYLRKQADAVNFIARGLVANVGQNLAAYQRASKLPTQASLCKYLIVNVHGLAVNM